MFNGKIHKIDCDKCTGGYIYIKHHNERLMDEYYQKGLADGTIPPCPPGVTQLAHRSSVFLHYRDVDFTVYDAYICPLKDKCEEGLNQGEFDGN